MSGGYIAVTDPESGGTYRVPDYDPACGACGTPENVVPPEHPHLPGGARSAAAGKGAA